VGIVACMGEMRHTYHILVGKSEGKRPHRFGHRWENNIGMDFMEMGWGGVNWVHLAEDMDHWWVLVNTVINLQIPQKAQNLLTS